MASDTSLRIVVTGASGFLGRQIIPRLIDEGFSVSTVGRDAKALAKMFQNCPSFSYEQLEELAPNNAIFLHLAVCNNDSKHSLKEYREINIDLLLATARTAKTLNALHFINVTSTHAILQSNFDPYGFSKATGAKRLTEEFPSFSSNIYLPLVYGNIFSGKLKIMNRIPSFLATPILGLLGVLKPKVHVDRVVDQIVVLARRPAGHRSIYLADLPTTTGLYAFIKRMMDIIASLGVMFCFWWLMLIVAVWVKLDSPGPAIFVQPRVGQHGRPFTCYKFRTMAMHTVQAATHEVAASQVTKIGAFLRQTKLDELPQIYNILRNEMSLVGPRPCLPSQIPLVAARQARGVLNIKPGITGFAQTRGIDMSDPVRLAEVDEQYCVYRSLIFDFRILIATVFGAGSGDRVAAEANDGIR